MRSSRGATPRGTSCIVLAHLIARELTVSDWIKLDPWVGSGEDPFKNMRIFP